MTTRNLYKLKVYNNGLNEVTKIDLNSGSKEFQNETLTSIINLKGVNTYVGTMNGLLIKIRDKTVESWKEAHQGAINIIYSNSNTNFWTGADDKFIRLWNSKLECERSVNIETYLSKITNIGVTSICYSANKQLLVGLRSGEIIYFDE